MPLEPYTHIKDVLGKLNEIVSPTELNASLLQENFVAQQENHRQLRYPHLHPQHPQNCYISPSYDEYVKRVNASNSLHILNEVLRNAKLANKMAATPEMKPSLMQPINGRLPHPPQLICPTNNNNNSSSKAHALVSPSILKSPPTAPTGSRLSPGAVEARPAMCHVCRFQFANIELLAKHYIECHPSLLPSLVPGSPYLNRTAPPEVPHNHRVLHPPSLSLPVPPKLSPEASIVSMTSEIARNQQVSLVKISSQTIM